MRIELVDEPEERLREAVNGELRRFNERENPVFWGKLDQPEHDALPLSLYAYDAEGEVVGGLHGSTRFKWLKVDVMSTREKLRGQGIGSALLARAESEALSRGCSHAYVDTMSYQAPGFYEKAGYRLAGTLRDWDSHGHDKLFFVKELR